MADPGWVPGAADQPLPPTNGTVVSPFLPGVLDIRWDNPALLAGNSNYHVVGVNLYRSDVSDLGPYFRLNEFPIGAMFYRDQTELVPVTEVIDWASGWDYKADAPNDRRWVFRVRQPMMKRIYQAPHQSPAYANAPVDVTLRIDGVEVPVEAVFGRTQQVRLINQASWNVATENFEDAVLPNENTVVEVTYWTARNHVRSGLGTGLFYRLTTVVMDSTTPSGYRETDLNYCLPMTNIAVERLDYIWQEAMRRNSWILQQGGERVKFFIRRTAGIPCDCQLHPMTREFAQQPSNRCLTCFGTGFVGGYEGPFEAIVAPDDAERRISQTLMGRRTEHTYEVFMGPSPVVTMRDFIVKQTNERYSIGAVRRPTNRGNLLQQHFNIGILDEGDIRYAVPIDGTTALAWPQTRYSRRTPFPMAVDGALRGPSWMSDPSAPQSPLGPDAQTPQGTDKAGWPPEKQPRGRTPVWENQNE